MVGQLFAGSQTLVGVKGDTVSLLYNFECYTDFEAKKRNGALANNTLKFIKANPKMRIIVLIGFAHRSFVLSELKKEGVIVSS